MRIQQSEQPVSAILDIQLASEHPDIPSETDIQLWLNTLLSHQQVNQAEVTIRMVDEEEIQALNLQYRGKDKTTNVLSFPFEIPELFLPETSPEALPEALADGLQIDDSMSDFLGDIVICAQVVEQESKEQNKHLNHHWAHMLIHGTLHLLGYDHIEEPDAEEMESIEITVLQKLAIDDPYQDH